MNDNREQIRTDNGTIVKTADARPRMRPMNRHERRARAAELRRQAKRERRRGGDDA